jgi:hypothetical protein
MHKIAVVIRVYNRVEDLENNIKIINSLWKNNNYDIFIVFNGQSAGYFLTQYIYDNASKVVNLTNNAGHLKGNSQLLIEGIQNIDNLLNYDFLLILEADTWLMQDDIISKYSNILKDSDAVWASSLWVESKYSLGLDFAIIKTDFILEHYKVLFNFQENPEMWIAEYLMFTNHNHIAIQELMPVHRPSIIKTLYNADQGRLRIFPKAKMLTHHVENLEGGIKSKKELANIMYKNIFFHTSSRVNHNFQYNKYLFFHTLLKYLPRSSWFKKKKKTFNITNLENYA